MPKDKTLKPYPGFKRPKLPFYQLAVTFIMPIAVMVIPTFFTSQEFTLEHRGIMALAILSVMLFVLCIVIILRLYNEAFDRQIHQFRIEEQSKDLERLNQEITQTNNRITSLNSEYNQLYEDYSKKQTDYIELLEKFRQLEKEQNRLVLRADHLADSSILPHKNRTPNYKQVAEKQKSKT